MSGRPLVFPDPNDRSPNHPSIIVSTEFEDKGENYNE